jgi:hypothetical protein
MGKRDGGKTAFFLKKKPLGVRSDRGGEERREEGRRRIIEGFS